MPSTASQASSVVYEPRSAESWRDPFPMYRALRDNDPVHRFENGAGEEVWALSRFKHVFDAAVDATPFTSAQGPTMDYDDMGKLGLDSPIVMMDPPDHTNLRKLAIKRFTPKQVNALEPLVRAFVIERVERLREMGKGDVVGELFKPLPSLRRRGDAVPIRARKGQSQGTLGRLRDRSRDHCIRLAAAALAGRRAHRPHQHRGRRDAGRRPLRNREHHGARGPR